MRDILRKLHRRFSPGFLERLVEWRSRRKTERLRRLSRYHLHPRSAIHRYFASNGFGLRSWLEFSPRLIRRAVECDYVAWPRKIAADVQARDVLELGCGTGLHAIGYLIVGVGSYLGIDPKMRLDQMLAKNRRTRQQERFGTTPRRMMRQFPRMRFLPRAFEEMTLDEDFDVVILHNVTEHLKNIEEVFHEVSRLLRPEGLLIFHHHNFYCWNGHHQVPKYVELFDPDDPRQQKFVDWNHLEIDAEKEEIFRNHVNRIRLDDLCALTEKLFRIETWNEVEIDHRRGAGRLTPQICERFSQYTARELTTQSVLCRARKSPAQG